MEDTVSVVLQNISRYTLPILGIAILLWCCISLLRRRPPQQENARLVDPISGSTKILHYGENAIGRSTVCDVRLTNVSTSRFHAVIAKRRMGWVVIDTRSKAGVFVNGEQIKKRAVLHTGDTVAFGPTAYVFRES